MRGRQQVLLFTIPVGAAILSSAACGQFLGIGNNEDDPPVSTPASDAGDGTSSTDAIGADGSVIPSDGSSGGELDADADLPLPVKVIFLSNTLFVPTPPGGRDRVDQVCQAEATAAGIALNKVIAWMSVTGSSAIDRLGLGDWRMPSSDNAGVNPPIQIFASKASIPNGPLSPINRGANGALISSTSDRVWTGTRASGKASTYDCINWGAQTGSAGTAGAVGVTDLTWTDNNANPGMSCDIEGHIICIEQ